MISWHRFYDPETGRYISADPLGLAGGTNLFVYTKNNSTNYTDPTGLRLFLPGYLDAEVAIWEFLFSPHNIRETVKRIKHCTTCTVVCSAKVYLDSTIKGIPKKIGVHYVKKAARELALELAEKAIKNITKYDGYVGNIQLGVNTIRCAVKCAKGN